MMASLTTEHTRLIALVLKSQIPTDDTSEFAYLEYGTSEYNCWLQLVQAFSRRFALNNHRFNAIRFMEQCGIDDPKTHWEILNGE